MKISTLHETVIKGSYLAVVLTPESKHTLLEWWESNIKTELLDRVIAHHVTLKHNPAEDDIKQYKIGQDVAVKVIGYLVDDLAQIVTVECPVKSLNAHPHITIAVRADIKPSISNKLLTSDKPTIVNGPMLNGVVEHVIPGRQHE